MTPKEIDRFRGWALTALYASMAVLGLLLVMAAYRLWPSVKDGTFEVITMGGAGIATVLLSSSTSIRYFRILHAGERPPQLALLPFFCLAVTILAFSMVFNLI